MNDLMVNLSEIQGQVKMLKEQHKAIQEIAERVSDGEDLPQDSIDTIMYDAGRNIAIIDEMAGSMRLRLARVKVAFVVDNNEQIRVFPTAEGAYQFLGQLAFANGNNVEEFCGEKDNVSWGYMDLDLTGDFDG